MKILYIHQYFTIPSEPGGTRSYWISKRLIENGHEITMLTASSSKNKNSNLGQVSIDDINVTYFDVPYHGSMGISTRLKAFLKFSFLTTLHVLKAKKNYDLIIATSTPLTVGIPALIGNLINRTPYVFEVRDLWPEVPIQMGGLKNKLAIKLANWFEETIYKRAAHIIALSPGMKDGVLAKGIPQEKVTMIPNMSKPDAFWPREKNLALASSLGLQKTSFKVIYFGAMGLANAMDYIVEGAKLLNNDADIEFIFAGGGGVEEEIREKCEQLKLQNVHFIGKFPMKELSEIVNIADVSLVTFKNLPILTTNSPNKLFDSLSAGKPIIVNSNGWTKKLVEDNNCGLYANPLSPADLASKITHLKNNPELAETMGRNSRILSEEVYDKDILCDQFAGVIQELSVKKDLELKT